MWKRLVAITLGLLLLGACGVSRGEAEKKKAQNHLDEMATKLGLTPDQKEQALKIHQGYEEKIRNLRHEEIEEVSKILTDDQKAKLQEILKEHGGKNKGTKEPGKENNSNNNNNNNDKKNENK